MITASPETRKLLEDRYGRPWHDSPENKAFINARWACLSPRAANYGSYGGKGISFLYKSLDEWITDLGLRPSDKHEIERLDADKNYEPGNGNLRWVLDNHSRPYSHADRSVEALMSTIMRALARNNGKMLRQVLQKTYTKQWGDSTVLNPVLEFMAESGLVHFEKEGRKLFVAVGEGDCVKIPVHVATSVFTKPNKSGRTVESLIEQIIKTLRRNSGEMTKGGLQRYSGAYKWGADKFKQTLMRLQDEGVIEVEHRKEVRLRHDGTGKKLGSTDSEARPMRQITETTTYIKLKENTHEQ